MKSRLTLATLAAAVALVAMPTASQAGGLHRMGDCLFGWLRHDRHVVAAAPAKKVKVKKAKKAKRVAAMPKK